MGQFLSNEYTNTDDTVLGTQTITDTFTYDHAGRVLSQTQHVSSGGVSAHEKIFNNTYNEMGVLTSKGVGGDVNAQNRLQTVDYAYNIRGWLKKINQDAFNDNDLFNFSLSYHEISDTNKKLYNGNISQTSWNTLNTDSSTKTYTYSYDAMDRLVSAIDNTGKYNLHYVSYDLNGNIQKLQRQGHVVANPSLNNASNFGMMDDLTYEYYTNSNKLKKVTDDGNTIFGFKDGSNTANEYSYDLNGNMISDDNKNIQSISYNHLGLAKGITSGVGVNIYGSIEYVYDAVGTKLEKKVISIGAATTTTRYAGGFVYKKVIPAVSNGNTPQLILEYFSHGEGYVKLNYHTGNNGENQYLTDYEYIYQYKDHLGNVRLSYADTDNNGTIDAGTEIIEESNYYPFGLEHKGYNNIVLSNGNSTAQKFKYNGKEFEEALGMNIYEMDVRSLDPALGRWMSIDPVTHHSMSTYNAFDNNPIYYADSSGADSDERVVLNRYRDGGLTRGCATGNCSSTETITKETGVNPDGSVTTSYETSTGEALEPGNGENDGTPDGVVENADGTTTYSSHGFGITRPSLLGTGNNQTNENDEIQLDGIDDGITDILIDASTTNTGFNPNNKFGMAIMAIIAADVAIADPTDVAVPKWLGYGIVLAGIATYDLTKRVYVTYTLTNPTTGQIYIGRSSGYGDPYSIMRKRFYNHGMRAYGFGMPILDRAVQGLTGYAAIRGREQQMIDFHGGVGSLRVGNRIRGVSRRNMAGRLYHSASNTYFGSLAPYTGF